MNEVPYYWVNPKNGRAYWRPTKAMQKLGFEVKALGPDSPEARAAAQKLTVRWRAARKEQRLGLSLGVRADLELDAEAPRRRPSYIYFLRAGEHIKIGISNTPFGRLQTIAAGVAQRISQAVVVLGGREDERRLHRRFRVYRTRGEWFTVSRPLLLTVMRSAAAGVVVHDQEQAENGTRVESIPEIGNGVWQPESNRGETKGGLSA